MPLSAGKYLFLSQRQIVSRSGLTFQVIILLPVSNIITYLGEFLLEIKIRYVDVFANSAILIFLGIQIYYE
jgi:hypothetical protein